MLYLNTNLCLKQWLTITTEPQGFVNTMSLYNYKLELNFTGHKCSQTNCVWILEFLGSSVTQRKRCY